MKQYTEEQVKALEWARETQARLDQKMDAIGDDEADGDLRQIVRELRECWIPVQRAG